MLDLSLYERPPSPVVQRRYDDGRVNVLFVGRIIPNKRIDDLIRCFAVFQRWLAAARAGSSWWATRGASSATSTGCASWCAELGVEEVVFTGHVDDDELYAYYRLADVFLCLSEHEGFCVPLQEAMHFGLPVIAYDAGAVRETLHGGGVLLQDKRPELVAELLDRVTHGGRSGGRSSRARPGPSPGSGPPTSARLLRDRLVRCSGEGTGAGLPRGPRNGQIPRDPADGVHR